MPFKCIRKIYRSSWPLEDMTQVMNPVKNKPMGIRKATYQVPFGTRQDSLNGKVSNVKKDGKECISRLNHY